VITSVSVPSVYSLEGLCKVKQLDADVLAGCAG